MSVEITGTTIECEGINVLTSSRPWDIEINAFIDADLIDPDLPVLDVGGGGSSVTARLLQLGYDAYALDPLYESRDTAMRVIDSSFAGIAFGSMLSGDETEYDEQKESFDALKNL